MDGSSGLLIMGGRRRRPLLLAAASGLTALVVAELGLRVLDLPRPDTSLSFLGEQVLGDGAFEEDETLFWRVDTESGLRGFLPAGAKGPRDYRVACVGDSCTFGSGVRYEETYGVRLERMLQEALPSWRVQSVLAGVPGYSTHQDRLLFNELVLPLEPDLTVFYCGGWNDYLPAIGMTDRERTVSRQGFVNGLRLTQLCRRLLRGPIPDREVYARALRDGRAPDGRRVSLSEFRENMEWMIRRATGSGSAVVLVVPPLAESVIRDVPIALDYRQAVRDLAREHGVPLVDAPLLFREHRVRAPEGWDDLPSGEWPCLLDWVHPTVLGHQVLAEELFRVAGDRLPAAGPSVPGRLSISSLSRAELCPLLDNRVEPASHSGTPSTGCGSGTGGCRTSR